MQYWVVNADAPALVGPLDRTDTWWAIAFGVGAEAGRNSAHRIIDALAGTAVEAEVLSTDPWTARMQIVDRMRDRRVFLAGDAAHLNPPFGGHGLNTGIGDAVDLGWKIAAVLAGWGGEQLLNSYEAERRPIQERVIAEASANMRVLSTELLADNLDDADAAGARAREAADGGSRRPRQLSSTRWSWFWSSGSTARRSFPATSAPQRWADGWRTVSCPTAGPCSTSSAPTCRCWPGRTPGRRPMPSSRPPRPAASR
ncbi:FAD-dependent monooxygenase [Catenulispora yoronensis]